MRGAIVTVALMILFAPPSSLSQTLESDPAWDQPGSYYGQIASTVALADLNGDGFDEVLLGGPFYFTPCCPSVNQQGVVLVYNGGPAGPSTTISWFEIGLFSGTTLGDRVARAGDVNGDGFDELLFNSGSGFGNGTHALHLRYGSPTGPGTAWNYDTGLEFGALGPSVAGGGDLDGDGFDDVIAGFPLIDGADGRLLVFRGSALGLPSVPDQALPGAADHRFGEQVAFAGDVDADGFDDVLVCERPPGAAQQIHLFRGSSNGLESIPAWTHAGPSLSCTLEGQFRGVGDLNRDGHDDIAVGVPFLNHGAGQGAVRLFFGTRGGLPGTADAILFGTDQFGSSVAPAGDVNADGFADLVVGGYGGSPGDLPGSTAVYFGTRLGIAPEPAWNGKVLADNRDLGWSVASGDVNGDGFADVVSGDPNSPPFFYGRALVYLNLGRLVAGPAGGLPDSGDGALRLSRGAGGEVALSWQSGCDVAGEDFIVYAGSLEDFASHLPVSPCGIGGGTSWSEPASGESRYYLVVPRSLDAEGSYGRESAGFERPASGDACFSQQIADCG